MFKNEVLMAAIEAFKTGLDLNPALMDVKGTYTLKGREVFFRLCDFEEEDFGEEPETLARSITSRLKELISQSYGRVAIESIVINQIAA